MRLGHPIRVSLMVPNRMETRAAHAYDPLLPEMSPLLIGSGPDLKIQQSNDPGQYDRLQQVDLYAILAYLLGVPRPIWNNASLARVAHLLEPSPGKIAIRRWFRHSIPPRG
ncbi:unnamed protein product [Protopolystoma xenopodis]|uniref:Uncharacterized protein n=1 Tax=Protopolystoma xenopodis TaxID=117903 RepID=A0A3S5CUT7_9PLAT|nr:unnamed protein product [Protopolystoma xenopodis]